MEKDFDKWNENKKKLEKVDKKYLFKTGDIWWCSVGLNIKDESCGKGEDFQRRFASLDDSDMLRVKEKLQILLELSDHHQDSEFLHGPESVGNPKSNLIIDEVENKVKQENEKNNQKDFIKNNN